MTEHTPKHWQLARFDPNTCFIEVETVERGTDVPDQGYFIAKMHAGPEGPYADNYLVTAAPDLLDALEVLVNHVLHYATMQHSHGDAHRDVAVARAAIAKARGVE